MSFQRDCWLLFTPQPICSPTNLYTIIDCSLIAHINIDIYRHANPLSYIYSLDDSDCVYHSKTWL
jgi:hypothetical protein